MTPMRKSLVLLAGTCLLIPFLAGCSGEPSNEELMNKYNDLPSNNPDMPKPPDDPRGQALGGTPIRKGSAPAVGG
jgi:hypothetical protein